MRARARVVAAAQHTTAPAKTRAQRRRKPAPQRVTAHSEPTLCSWHPPASDVVRRKKRRHLTQQPRCCRPQGLRWRTCGRKRRMCAHPRAEAPPRAERACARSTMPTAGGARCAARAQLYYARIDQELSKRDEAKAKAAEVRRHPRPSPPHFKAPPPRHVARRAAAAVRRLRRVALGTAHAAVDQRRDSAVALTPPLRPARRDAQHKAKMQLLEEFALNHPGQATELKPPDKQKKAKKEKKEKKDKHKHKRVRAATPAAAPPRRREHR